MRGAVLLVVVGVALGVVMGVVWSSITPDLTFEVAKGGGVIPTGATNDNWFSADGWFAVLGVFAGVLLAVVAWWRVRAHPVAALMGVLIGGVAAALSAWWVGGFLGPDDPGSLTHAPVGSTVVAQLGLRATGVLVIPALVGVFLFVMLATFTVPREEVAEPE